MKKIKTGELIGAQLDWAVAVALNAPARINMAGTCDSKGHYRWERWHPSISWMHGGPIIAREQICIEPHAHFVENESRGLWRAVLFYNGGEDYSADGQTALIAAMRAFVGSKLGDEVEVPEVAA